MQLVFFFIYVPTNHIRYQNLGSTYGADSNIQPKTFLSVGSRLERGKFGVFSLNIALAINLHDQVFQMYARANFAYFSSKTLHTH